MYIPLAPIGLLRQKHQVRHEFGAFRRTRWRPNAPTNTLVARGNNKDDAADRPGLLLLIFSSVDDDERRAFAVLLLLCKSARVRELSVSLNQSARFAKDDGANNGPVKWNKQTAIIAVPTYSLALLLLLEMLPGHSLHTIYAVVDTVY